MAPTYSENSMLRDQIGRQEYINARCADMPPVYQALMPVTCKASILVAAEQKIRRMMAADAARIVEGLVAADNDTPQEYGVTGCVDWSGESESRANVAGAEYHAARAVMVERNIRMVAAVQIELARAVGRQEPASVLVQLREQLREAQARMSRMSGIRVDEFKSCSIKAGSDWVDPLSKL